MNILDLFKLADENGFLFSFGTNKDGFYICTIYNGKSMIRRVFSKVVAVENMELIIKDAIAVLKASETKEVKDDSRTNEVADS